MTTTLTRSDTSRSTQTPLPALGLVAAGTGVAGTMLVLPDVPAAARRNPEALVDAVLASGQASLRLSAALLAVSAVVVAVLGSHLRRRLDEHGPAVGTHATVHIIGITVAVVGLLTGAAGAAQLAWVIEEGESALVATAFNVVDTVPFAAFIGVGLAAGAWAVTAIRQGVGARWFGNLSAVVAVITALLALGGLPFLSFVPGAVWLAAAGFVARR